MRRTLAAAAAAITILGFSGTSSAQDYRAQINRLVEAMDEAMTSNGMSRTLPPQTGSLNDDATVDYSVQLQAGRAYQIVGVCDTDCSDLDLSLFSPTNDLIVEDTLTDDAPIVSVTPTASANYRLQVKMYACSVDPCYFGVAVYAR